MSVRVTQSTTESSLQSGAGKVRFTQGTVESSFASGVGKVRFTQGTAEVSIQSGVGKPRLTQIAIEVSIPPVITSFLPHSISPIHQKRRARAKHVQKAYLLHASKKKFPFLFVAT